LPGKAEVIARASASRRVGVATAAAVPSIALIG
jgi:hypothetical protein